VETLSLDELDEAFQADHIKDTTLVCRVGGNKWVTLAELASLDDEPDALTPSAPIYVAPMTPPAAYVPVAPVPNSVAPVAIDFSLAALDDDLDLEALALRPKRRALWVVSGLAVASLAGVAALVLAGKVSFAPPRASQAAAMLKPPAVAAASPPLVDARRAAAEPTSAAPVAEVPAASTPANDRFSDDMNKALLEADDKPVAKKSALAAKKSGKLRKAKPVRVKSKRKGKGNAFDPLNGSL
jgi:hypothetical protein